MDPATAGTFGFLIRLVTMAFALLLALSVAGVSLQTLAVGGAFTAVVLGLAAQQTLGNVIAGMVLLSARPFRVGERVRLQAGAVGGSVEGIVSSLGLLYTTLVARRRPDHDPQQRRAGRGGHAAEGARLGRRQGPSQLRRPAQPGPGDSRPGDRRADAHGASVLLEEVDGDDVVVRVQATPEMPDEGAKLADEIMVALSSVTGEHEAAATNSMTEAAQGAAVGAQRCPRWRSAKSAADPVRAESASAPRRESGGN